MKDDRADTSNELIESEPDLDLDNFLSKSASMDNFPQDPMERWQLAALATGPSCRAGSEILGQEFPLQHWMVHIVEIIQDDGEIVSEPRVVLFDTSGNCFGFTSSGVYNSLRLLVQSIASAWPPEGVNIVIREGKSRKGRKFYCIEPAGSRTTTKTKAK